MEIEWLNFSPSYYAFTCPNCFRLVIVKKKRWKRMFCPHCKEQINRNEIIFFIPIKKVVKEQNEKFALVRL